MENKKNRVTGESTFKFPLLGNKKIILSKYLQSLRINEFTKSVIFPFHQSDILYHLHTLIQQYARNLSLMTV